MNKEQLIAKFIKDNLDFDVDENGEVYLTRLVGDLIGDHLGDHIGLHFGNHQGNRLGWHDGDNHPL